MHSDSAFRGIRAKRHADPNMPQQQQSPISPPLVDLIPDISNKSALVAALEDAIAESLRCYIFTDAIFYAERLFDLVPDYQRLRTLAHCYMSSGDAATACRLLQHHYPFFEVHVSRPSSAGTSRTSTRGFVGPQHHFSPMHRPGGGSGSGSGSSSPLQSGPVPIGVRAAMRRGDDGEAVLTHETVDLAARWECQYLLGVCCCQTQRYTEGGRVLEELFRISTRLSEEDRLATAAGRAHSPTASADEASLGGSGGGGMDTRIILGATTVGHPHYYRQRLGQVQYWIGVAARNQHQDHAAEMFSGAFTQNPHLISAFEEYVKSAPRPLDSSCLSTYVISASAADKTAEGGTAVANAHSGASHATPPPMSSASIGTDASARPPRPAVATFSPNASPRTSTTAWGARQQSPHHGPVRSDTPTVGGGGSTTTTGAPNQLTRFILPFVSASFYMLTYSCERVLKLLETITPTSHGVPLSAVWRLGMHANALFHSGDMVGSAEVFAQLLQQAPWRLNDQLLVTYSTALWHMRTQSGLGYLAQRLAEEMPLSPITLCVVANLYSLVKEPTEALEMLNRAIQMDPRMASAYTLKGYELLDLDEKAEAEGAFNSAIYADRHLYMAYAGMGEKYLREEQIEDARRYYRHALSLNPFPTIMNRYAATYHRRGASEAELNRAITVYEAALRQHPNNLLARQQHADVLVRLGRCEEAYQLLREMIRHHSEEAMAFLTLAKCVQAMGRSQEAIHFYQRALCLDPRREAYIRHCMEKLAAGERRVE